MSVRAPTIELVDIPAGVFLMGEGGDAHTVDVPPFQMARYPVTTAAYHTFVAASGYAPPNHWPHGRCPEYLAQHPVVNVTWGDALAYCRWLSAETGRAFRLPTEAEWEKAARGSDGRDYPWGDTFHKENCNTWETAHGRTMPVDAFPEGASPYGVLDMAGNVWEWCSTLFDAYPYAAGDGREDLEAAGWRVLRGGSWYDAEWGVRAARRLGSPAGYASHNTGFRVVCAV